MKCFFSALLAFLPTFFGLLGILGLFEDHRPSKHGPAFDQNQQYQMLISFAVAAATLWLWLNTFFKLARIPVLDALCVMVVLAGVPIELYLITEVGNFRYSGDDGWFVKPMILLSYVIYTFFGTGFALIVGQRYFPKVPVKKKERPSIF